MLLKHFLQQIKKKSSYFDSFDLLRFVDFFHSQGQIVIIAPDIRKSPDVKIRFSAVIY